ncbi:PQQ-binding-like beta-propeller repeat protein [Blastopirellula retiformator]|uniref:Uncharacterized protein n=1 Tax=Blastopirellula retiformator TaxID=2527970 RepID=A0A5C5VP81_9BACT|nr:hypothetical protein [Blastopirellula retiformator]TWT39452.1 hypothetical protein Enr8_11510 [Blastopirellula retiformator]
MKLVSSRNDKVYDMRVCRATQFVLAAFLVLATLTPVYAQGFGDARRYNGYIDAEPLLIVIPDSRDCALAYNAESDDWDKVEFSTPLPGEGSPVAIGGDVAVFVHEGVAYGYSVETSRWASIKLDDPKTPGIPVIGGKLAAVIHGDFVYGFGAKHGVWAKAKLSSGSKAKPIIGSTLIKVIDGNVMLVFGEASKRFSGVDLTNGEMVKLR